MKKLATISLCILAAFTSNIAMANTAKIKNPQPVYFIPDFGREGFGTDWALTCDNIGTCRADGSLEYENTFSEDDNLRNASLLIVRQAGKPKVTMKVNLQFFEDKDYISEESVKEMEKKSAQMFINGQSYGKVPLKFEGSYLNDTQTKGVLQHIKGPIKIEFRLDKMHTHISTYGLKEVLIKMDELQGFTNTPYALWQKGNNPAPTTTYSYPKLKDKPIIGTKATVDRNSADGKKLISLLRNDPKTKNMLSNNDYDLSCLILDDDKDIGEYDKEISQQFDTVQLSQDKKLAMGICWTAAYNMGYGAWVVDNQFNKVYQAVGVDLSSQEGNQLFLAIKGRGLGDCWTLGEWTWDGNQFVETFSGDTGMCRGFAGGAWYLPSKVVDVESIKDDISRFD